MRYYKYLRLRRARLLLTQSNMPVLDVAVACGFGSMSHFAKDYRVQFGRRPREERTRARDCAPAPQPARSGYDRSVRSAYIPS